MLRSIGTANFAIMLILLGATTLPVAADDFEWEWSDDELCTDCMSFRDEDVGAGDVQTAYVPTIGFRDKQGADSANADRVETKRTSLKP